jgi:hypothetical protein
MAKGTATPEKTKRQREGLAALKGSNGDSAADILKQLEREENEAFEKFQTAQREKREKALANVLEPMKKERSELAQSINEANIRIKEIDAEIAKLTGQKERPSRGGSGGGKRFRPSEDEIADAAKALGSYATKVGKHNEFSRKDILGQLGDKWAAHVPKLIERWNAENASHKIGTNGKEKALSRYVLK